MNVLIVDESECTRGIVRGLLTPMGVASAAEAATVAEAATLLARFPADLVIIGGHPTDPRVGPSLADAARAAGRRPPAVVPLAKPFSRADLAQAVRAASAEAPAA